MKYIKENKCAILVIPSLILAFNLLVVLYPKEALGASRDGLMLWFNSVLPSLLPFMITTNILISLGVPNYIGALFEPLMQPAFGVGGKGAFPFILGISSGYPMGAKITAQLRQNNEISAVEAQKLLAFVNNSGPLFVLGAVGAGMFGSAKAGYFLMLVHFLSAILNGLLFKYYGDKSKSSRYPREKSHALSSMRKARGQKSLSLILSDSLYNAIESILQIGGYIILFSVLVKICEIINIISLFEALLSTTLRIESEEFKGLFYGILEITGGANQLSLLPLSRRVLLITAFIISFGGFSIHAQSLNFLSKCQIKIGVYLLSKLSQGILASLLAYALFPLFSFENALPVFYYYYLPEPGVSIKASLIVLLISSIAFVISLGFVFLICKIQEVLKANS